MNFVLMGVLGHNHGGHGHSHGGSACGGHGGGGGGGGGHKAENDDHGHNHGGAPCSGHHADEEKDAGHGHGHGHGQGAPAPPQEEKHHGHGHAHGGGGSDCCGGGPVAKKAEADDGKSENELLVMRAAIAHVVGDILQSVGVCVAGALIWAFSDRWLDENGISYWHRIDPVCTFVFSILVMR